LNPVGWGLVMEPRLDELLLDELLLDELLLEELELDELELEELEVAKRIFVAFFTCACQMVEDTPNISAVTKD